MSLEMSGLGLPPKGHKLIPLLESMPNTIDLDTAALKHGLYHKDLVEAVSSSAEPANQLMPKENV